MTSTLPTAALGRTGLRVTRLGYGGVEIGGQANRDPADEAESSCILKALLDAGINYVDTANDYGLSEERIGRHIATRRREYFLATKCGCLGPGGGPHDWTRDNCVRGLEQSLALLQTDYVDLMQPHNPTVDEAEANGLAETLRSMRDQGSVRHIGISTTLPHLPTYIEWGVFDAFQIPYSALNREHEDWISRAAAAGIGTIIRGGVQRGEPGVGLGPEDVWETFNRARLDDLREAGESRTAFMLRFTLSHPDIQTIIVGTKNPYHLAENVSATLRGPLEAGVYAEAKRRLDDAGESPAPVS